MKYFSLIWRNLRRSYVRTGLTALGTMVLVLVVTLVWSILAFLGKVTSEKTINFKAIVTERWQIPSQMPMAYAAPLSRGAARKRGDVRPEDAMTWQFYLGTTEKDAPRTQDNTVFGIAMAPESLDTMMNELDSLPAAEAAELRALVERWAKNRQGMVVGKDQLRKLGKQVGDRITLYGINYRDINLELEIVGILPPGRYDPNAFFQRDYLLASLDAYRQSTGKEHPIANKTLNLVWLRVADSASMNKVVEQIESSSEFTTPQVKCETESSAIGSFMEAWRDLIWLMRFLLAPAIIVTLALVISTSISIGVRERRSEMAVMKVLGFRPWQLLILVLGEAVLLGAVAGFASAGATRTFINLRGGIPFQIAFFPAFFIPADALWWGPLVGGGAALAGSLIPAWSARSVKVAEVFAKVA